MAFLGFSHLFLRFDACSLHPSHLIPFHFCLMLSPFVLSYLPSQEVLVAILRIQLLLLLLLQQLMGHLVSEDFFLALIICVFPVTVLHGSESLLIVSVIDLIALIKTSLLEGCMPCCIYMEGIVLNMTGD